MTDASKSQTFQHFSFRCLRRAQALPCLVAMARVPEIFGRASEMKAWACSAGGAETPPTCSGLVTGSAEAMIPARSAGPQGKAKDSAKQVRPRGRLPDAPRHACCWAEEQDAGLLLTLERSLRLTAARGRRRLEEWAQVRTGRLSFRQSSVASLSSSLSRAIAWLVDVHFLAAGKSDALCATSDRCKASRAFPVASRVSTSRAVVCTMSLCLYARVRALVLFSYASGAKAVVVPAALSPDMPEILSPFSGTH